MNQVVALLHILVLLTTCYTSAYCSYGFIENKGQVVDQQHQPNPAVKYLLQLPKMSVQLKAAGFSYDTYALLNTAAEDSQLNCNIHRIDVELIGANPNATIVADNLMATTYNYYNTASTPEGIRGVREYGKITYLNIYNGIDLEFCLNGNGHQTFKYNFIVHPGADPNQIKISYKSGQGSVLTDKGIVIATSNGPVVETIPSSFLLHNHAEVPVVYTKLGDGTYGFKVSDYNRAETLIIDPVPTLVWGSYFGGFWQDNLQGLSLGPNDEVYVSGNTRNTNIATTGVFQTVYADGLSDGVIAKFNPTGQLVWATYLGGTGRDYLDDVAYDGGTHLYVAGQSYSTGLGTPGVFQTNNAGDADFLLAKFDTSGQRVWTTYFGGTNGDILEHMAIDHQGNIYMGGWVLSGGLATSGTHQTTNSPNEAILAKFSPTGQRIWSTYFGGPEGEKLNSIAFDHLNRPVVVGHTFSSTNIAFGTQTQYGGGTEMFVARFNTDGTISKSAYLTGLTEDDNLTDVAIDSKQNILVVGNSNSPNSFGTPNTHQPNTAGYEDGVLMKLDTNLNIIWGTYYGGPTYTDYFDNVAVDVHDNIFAWGQAGTASGIATPGALQGNLSAGAYKYNFMLVKFDKDGVRLWGTYYGGESIHLAYHTGTMQLNANNDIFIAGVTEATYNTATPGTHSPTSNGTSDGFIVKFHDQCAGIVLNDTVTNVTCYGDNNGSIAFGITGTQGPTTISWSGTSQSVSPLTNLGIGTYKVTVTDNQGCAYTKCVEITQPDSLIITLASSIEPTCYGGSDGQLSIAVSGGVPPYTVNWSNGANANTNLGIPAGVHTVTVTDAQSCIMVDTFTLAQPPIFSVSLLTQSVLCNGAADGSITSNVIGGSAAFQYEWSNGQTNDTATNLAADMYTLTVTDANNCTTSASATVGQPNPVVVSFTQTTPATCAGLNDGSITAQANGGTGLYTYEWSNGANTATIDSLLAQQYTVTATDANGCTGVGNATVANLPQQILVTLQSSHEPCTDITTNYMKVSATGGVPPYTYAWNNGLLPDTVHTGFPNGNYSVTVTDSRGCSGQQSVGFVPSLYVDAGILSGSATATIGDSVLYSVNAVNQATYSWSVVGGHIVYGFYSPTVLVVWDSVGANSVECVVTVAPCSDTVTKQVSTITSIYNSFTQNVFSIYPVPSSEIISVESDYFRNNQSTIKVYDVVGKLLYTIEYDAIPDGIHHINIANLSVGIYIVEIASGPNSIYKRIEKM